MDSQDCVSIILAAVVVDFCSCLNAQCVNRSIPDFLRRRPRSGSCRTFYLFSLLTYAFTEFQHSLLGRLCISRFVS